MWCTEACYEDISESSSISPEEVFLEVGAGHIASKCLVECSS